MLAVNSLNEDVLFSKYANQSYLSIIEDIENTFEKNIPQWGKKKAENIDVI